MSKILQFGEGNFLRAFAEVLIQDSGLSVSLCQPRTNTRVINALKAQDNNYNVYVRGLLDGKNINKTIPITCVDAAIDSAGEYEKLAEAFCNDKTELIISNTTEAGIVYNEDENTFPLKITKLLYERYKTGAKPLVFLPCELIDGNGDELKRCVLKYNALLGYGIEEYINSCRFYNTLVDRIVTGHPEGDSDPCSVACEPYISFVVEAPEGSLPIKGITYTDDIKPYKKRKVRILNGLHTFFVPSAILAGFEIVRDTVNDSLFNDFINLALGEILPTLEGDTAGEFASSVLERFANPYIDHRLDAIVLNSVSKFKTRLLGTILDSKDPDILLFSLAALLYFYKNASPVDDEKVIDYIKNSDINSILRNEELWGEDISRFENRVSDGYKLIELLGIKGAINEKINQNK
ncbi:MAG: hypothetical protein IJT65_05215 [Eubacterium sp.]|nr:hypothetical protein [Eubacterium sp.]